MKHQYAIQQNNTFATYEEIRAVRSSVETMVCPKPRRLGLVHAAFNEPSYVRPLPLRWQHAPSFQQDVCDAKAGNELLDIILSKGGAADQTSTQIASSPPFFSGSPPSRVSNPLIQDARFGNDEYTPVSPRAIPTPSGLAPSPTSNRKGGCTRANFGNNPAVRVEGFDCLDRDSRRNCSIPTLA